ncbi:Tryptophan synthase beta chain (EC [uncultured Gammaproteobacteria bacterium]|nr:Tryptophan synthase beta chain (EC [uncultured Gammaproteobacteria bacterium]
MMVRDFQSVIGKEAKTQFAEQVGGLPDALIACVGGGSNAIGLFHAFIDDKSVDIYGVEAAGHGIEKGPTAHAAPLCAGSVGVLHGNRTYLMEMKMVKSLKGIQSQQVWIILVLGQNTLT